jgi:hypothetical protein
MTYCFASLFRTFELFGSSRDTPSSPATLAWINEANGIFPVKLQNGGLLKSMLAFLIAVGFFERLLGQWTFQAGDHTSYLDVVILIAVFCVICLGGKPSSRNKIGTGFIGKPGQCRWNRGRVVAGVSSVVNDTLEHYIVVIFCIPGGWP